MDEEKLKCCPWPNHLFIAHPPSFPRNERGRSNLGLACNLGNSWGCPAPPWLGELMVPFSQTLKSKSHGAECGPCCSLFPGVGPGSAISTRRLESCFQRLVRWPHQSNPWDLRHVERHTQLEGKGNLCSFYSCVLRDERFHAELNGEAMWSVLSPREGLLGPSDRNFLSLYDLFRAETD